MTATMRSRGTSEGAAEAYRALRSSVKFAAGETPIRTVLVVDVDRQEPSGVAMQLARSFAQAGDRSVLVETDVRSGTGKGPGLTDLVAGSAVLADVVYAGGMGEPVVVSAGTDATPDVLASAGLSTALDALRDAYDIVVLSCASLPRYGDALAIAPRVDATILVVTSAKTRRPKAIEARDALERVGARILGVVMVETKRRLFW